MGKLKLWSHEEDCILAAVSSSTSSKKWKKASEQLKKQGYERTDIECRQRYVNHLDPTVNKQSWTDEELEVLYTKYSEYGNKWFLIQKHLPGRTQTKIKNYFYGNIRYLLKIILKFAFGKNRTGFVNDIKTQTLLEMYEGKGGNNRTYSEFAGETIIQKSIKRMDFRVSRNNCQKLMEDNMQVFSLFGKKYLMVKQKKQEVEVKAQEDFSYLQEKKVQNGLPQQELKFPKVDVVSSVEGEVNRKEQELAYLEKMAKLHYEKYLHFQSLLNISELRPSE